MSTTHQAFEGLKGNLNQIGHHLLKVEGPLLPEQKPSGELAYLEKLNGILIKYRQQFLEKGRAFYQGLKQSDLPLQLATLKTTLNAHLQLLDRNEQIDGKSRKSFMTFEAGFTVLANENALSAHDRLLHPLQQAMLERVPQGITSRPGFYALTFRYQEQTVELAGAFVLTEKSNPVVADLTSMPAVGEVMLFTPSRGIESFGSLAQLNTHLLQGMGDDAQWRNFMQLLPARFRDVTPGAIWPLKLSPIDDKPLFEHTYNALIDKRTQDINRALSLVDNPEQQATQLIDALDRAIVASLPDITARLEWRAQRLLERHLRNSAPDWYRSASDARRATLAEHLGGYNEARQNLLDLLGPVTTPETLARYQLLERLSDDLSIHDLAPEHLVINTRRYVDPIGEYEHEHNLVDLALRGPQAGDERPGSDFLTKTTLTYKGAPLPEVYQDLTPAWLAQQLATLQPRLDFAELQNQMHEKPALSRAIEQMLDQRINALAYAAVLQGHLSEGDFQLVQRLRLGTDAHLSAATLSLHAAQLQDLWVLRQSDASGKVIRLLLCTPEAPREQQFQAFNSEIACQNHILGWSLDNGTKNPIGTLTDYLIKRIALRFRGAMKQVLNGLSFKFHTQENKEIRFGNSGSHADCLKAMSAHVLATRVDDYEFSTPNWYRSTSTENRQTLLKLAEDTDGALHAYSEYPLSDARFPSFTRYLHEQAKKRLNELLGRRQNDVDPDTVWALSPPALIGSLTSPPLTYTQLYRDGYTDGVGFLDEKFSRSARFKGPKDVDLSLLTAEKVARSVTGVWIGQRYINEVKTRLLNTGSADYDLRRNATLSITQRQMQSAALECRLQGHLAGVDWQWLERSIASMGDTSSDTRGTYAIHRLLVDGDWVIGNFLFSHASYPTLLYTPDAPDGISFREAQQFNYLLKKNPGMVGYLTTRVGAQSQARVRAFLEDAKRQLPEDLNKTDVSPARYDSTRSKVPLLDLRHALYDMKQQRKIDDVEGTTANRSQMITGILWSCVEWVTAIATAPFPTLSLSLGMLLAFKDGMLALHAYHQGDTGAALEHLIGYVLNSAGAAFTDLRPALFSLKQLAKPVLHRAPVSAASSEAIKLIRPLEPTSPAPAGMQAVLFAGEVLWAKNTPDAIGRYLLYRLDPVSGRMVSTTRVAAPDAQGVWRRTGVVGGAPKYEKLPDTPQPLKQYEVPENYVVELEIILNPKKRASILENKEWLTITQEQARRSAALDVNDLHEAYLKKTQLLEKDAQDFFKNLPPLPARTEAPTIEASTTFKQLLDSDVFAGDKNLVIGAVPGSIASKQLLIMEMDTLVKKGFKRLYVEYLPIDVFRPKLKKLNQNGTWQHIAEHLRSIDQAMGFAENAEYSYRALVRTAQEKKMKINALDASTSYHLDDVLQFNDAPVTIPRDNAVRNFYSHKVIEIDAKTEPDGRWIALVDQSRMRTFNEIPGLADLQKNTIAVRIEDVGPNQPIGLWTDTAGAITGDALAKGDYRITLETSYKVPEPIAGARQVEPAAEVATAAHSVNEFDIPISMRDEIDRQYYTPNGLNPIYSYRNEDSRKALSVFANARTRLQDKAERFFTDYTPPSRPALPTITESTTPESFLKEISDSNLPGLVLGESHSAQSSKKLLITDMKEIQKLGFKTLYVEHLCTDLHQAELDVFHKTQRLPDKLKRYLKSQDRGHMPLHYGGSNTYSEVYQAASKYGIRVKALDCTASYNLKGVGAKYEARTKMFNYFASRVIQADQAAQGPHKWIAFVGNAHGNYHVGVPGLAEILGTVSLEVRDVAPGLGRKIHRAAWETVIEETGWPALRSDFKLEEAIAGNRAPAPIISIDRSRLKVPGHFLIERPSAIETNLVHYSSTGKIESTPIQVNDKGLFFIDRWDMKEQYFEYQSMLIDMLKAKVRLTPAP
ncbi:toxin [Pseudomonas sp. ADAK18]|uniref:membrane-targeted effector domain-containing toxin n=1 Tax=Pseudomonas sp. ADAK18 TaxID=2730848 RepID=UPI0014632141|nr:membrane-targeted effector domain-containing toxin [Pseudomonas sp. ADAK18]QJI27512.1 toxin [Pseudomonas sp. ADAK18]